MEGLRDEADKAKRECLEVKKIAEEKEVLFKQEQAALRKVRHSSGNRIDKNFPTHYGFTWLTHPTIPQVFATDLKSNRSYRKTPAFLL